MRSPATALSILGLALLAIPLTGATQAEKLSAIELDELKNSKPVIEYITPKGMKSAPHFSPVVRSSAKSTIYVSGMTGQFNGKSDALEEYKIQLRQAYDKIGTALKTVGATPQDIVRQRVLIKGISPQHAAITREVMMKFYGDAKPSSTASGTSGLFNPALVVEVDVTAVLAK